MRLPAFIHQSNFRVGFLVPHAPVAKQWRRQGRQGSWEEVYE